MGKVAVCRVGPPRRASARGFGLRLMGREGGKEGRRGDRLFNSPANPGARFICTAARSRGKGSALPGPVPEGLIRVYSMRFCPYAKRTLLVLRAKGIR